MAAERFRFRVFTSYLLTWCFLILLVSGIVLFIAPPGRIANWTIWRMGGLTKNQWMAIHTLVALMFLIAGFFHLLKFNWKVFWHYLTRKHSQPSRVQWEMIASLLVTILVLVGTGSYWQPFVSIIDLGESAKNSWETPRDAPPIPHLEVFSIKEVAGDRLKMPLEKAMETLRQAGLKVEGPQQKWKDLAAVNGKSPADLYLLLQSKSGVQPAVKNGAADTPAENHAAGSGLGQKTIAEAAQELGITPERALVILKEKGMECSLEDKVRSVADRNGKRPFEIVETLKSGLSK